MILRGDRGILISTVFVLALFWAGAEPVYCAQNPRRCESLLTASEAELGSIRKEFKHNTSYALEVPTTPIKDQCFSRSCWIYSGTSNLEQKVLTATGKPVDLSEPYLIISSMRLKVREALATPGQQFGPGGAAGAVDLLVQKFGAVPESAWRPRVDFQKAAIGRRFYYFLNNRIARFHLDAANARENEIGALRDEAHRDLLELIESYSGPLPKSFEYEGKVFESPREFAKHLIPADGRKTVKLVPRSKKVGPKIHELIERHEKGASPSGPSELDGAFEVKHLSKPEIVEAIKQALRRGESVRLSIENAHEFIDERTGIMSIGAFVVPEGFKPVPRRYRAIADFKGGGHAVEVVAIDFDSAGNVIKFKIKNSHGTHTGDGGFMHMYWDYFSAFVLGAYIRQ